MSARGEHDARHPWSPDNAPFGIVAVVDAIGAVRLLDLLLMAAGLVVTVVAVVESSVP